jgi:hypothetical protein
VRRFWWYWIACRQWLFISPNFFNGVQISTDEYSIKIKPVFIQNPRLAKSYWHLKKVFTEPSMHEAECQWIKILLIRMHAL